jgi:hypothetical protein
MALHTQRPPAANKMSYANYLALGKTARSSGCPKSKKPMSTHGQFQPNHFKLIHHNYCL